MRETSVVVATGSEVDPYGITSRPAGLVVLGPDLVALRSNTILTADEEVATAVSQTEWVEIDIKWPIGTSSQVARNVQRLYAAPGTDTRARWVLNPEDVEEAL